MLGITYDCNSTFVLLSEKTARRPMLMQQATFGSARVGGQPDGLPHAQRQAQVRPLTFIESSSTG